MMQILMKKKKPHKMQGNHKKEGMDQSVQMAEQRASSVSKEQPVLAVDHPLQTADQPVQVAD